MNASIALSVRLSQLLGVLIVGSVPTARRSGLSWTFKDGGGESELVILYANCGMLYCMDGE